MRRAAILGLALCVAVAGCGDAGEQAAAKPTLTVSAAASLKRAFTAYAEQFPDADVRLSFAGSDELAAQIEQGVKPDVFASANTKLPDRLAAEDLVGEPTVFTSNRLVLAVPASGARVASLEDAGKPGTTLAIGSKSAPIGAYTRTVLDRLPDGGGAELLGNVKSEEPDVGGIVGKLTLGAVDAGFVYASDVRGAGGKLEAIELDAALQPTVAYGVAVVTGAKEPEAAKAFVAGLLAGRGRDALDAAGFAPPPLR